MLQGPAAARARARRRASGCSRSSPRSPSSTVEHRDLLREVERASPAARYRTGAYRAWLQHTVLLLGDDDALRAPPAARAAGRRPRVAPRSRTKGPIPAISSPPSTSSRGGYERRGRRRGDRRAGDRRTSSLERGASVTVYERGAPGAGAVRRRVADLPPRPRRPATRRARRGGACALAGVGAAVRRRAAWRRWASWRSVRRSSGGSPLLRAAGVRARMVDAAVELPILAAASGAGDARRGRRRDPHHARRSTALVGALGDRLVADEVVVVRAVGRGPRRRRCRAATTASSCAPAATPRRWPPAPGSSCRSRVVDPHALRVSGARAGRRSPCFQDGDRRRATATRCPATTVTRSGSATPTPTPTTSPSACRASEPRRRRGPDLLGHRAAAGATTRVGGLGSRRAAVRGRQQPVQARAGARRNGSPRGDRRAAEAELRDSTALGREGAAAR